MGELTNLKLPVQNHTNNALGLQKVLFPFSQPGPNTWTDNTPYLGGWIRVLSNITAGASQTISHGLRGNPRSCIVLSSYGQYAPTPQQVNANLGDNSNIYIKLSANVGASPSFIVLLIF